jgi:signal recognition particle subunit SRP72
VQLAYCLQSQNREKEAQVIYNAALKQKPDDLALVAIASNNLVAINREQNVFDSKKKLRSATADGLENKLTTKQQQSIAVNQCLLTGLTGTAEQCNAVCEKTVAQYPTTSVDLALIQALALTREGKLSEAATVLQNEGKKHPDKKLDLKLAAVQLYLTEVI